MELRQLQYFLKVCETLHFSKAAEELNIAQQPLSFQIHKLEEELGFTLFERTTRSVSITPAGKEFQENIAKAFSYIKQGAENGKNISEGKIGKLRIGYNSLILSTSLTHKINDFKEQYPEMELELEELNSPTLENAVLDGTIDIGIMGLLWENYKELNYLEIAEEQSCIAIPKSWKNIDGRSIEIEQIKEQPFITYSPKTKTKLYHDFISACHYLGFDPKIIQTAETDLAVLGLVSSGLGVAFVPYCYKNIYSDSINYKPIKNHKLPIKIELVWNEKYLQPKAQNLIDLLVKDNQKI
jgi:DNA-binding transcriptional LysR family regulator